MYIERVIPIKELLTKKSVLLLGPRRTGKSSFIAQQLSPDKYYNLLHADTFRSLSARPSLIRESITNTDKLIVIDEIQKLPILMDEVHAMIEEFDVKFLLTGSSARKLRRTHTSLMAGRAKALHFFPFVSEELGNFDLQKIIQYGTLPPVYLSDDPFDELSDYVGLYLKEEIQAESFVRKIENFSHFLEIAAKSNTEIINFASIASDSQVPPRTVREYFNLLADTLMGTLVSPIKQQGKRKVVTKSKFYFFDIGVVNALLGRKSVSTKSPEFGNLFEHFIFLEIQNYIHALRRNSIINYWQISQTAEVDFIIDQKIAIEVKATSLATEKHLKGLKTMGQDYPLKAQYLISQDSVVRKIGEITILPYEKFCQKLWNGEIF